MTSYKLFKKIVNARTLYSCKRILYIIVAVQIVLFMLTSCSPLSSNQSGDTGEDNAVAKNSRLWGLSVAYDNNTFVVINTTTDVFESADKTSLRVTQLLFNQPVQVVAQNDRWAKVTVDENDASGWVRAREIDSDWTCIDPRRYQGRIVITSREKQVYSHPRNGTVLRDVGMGTELFFYTRSDNVYEVALPGNLIGWISESGTFQLDVDEAIKKTSADIFVQSCEKFIGVSYLLGGVGSLGIDSAGIIYIAMKINGVSVPHDFNGQFECGEDVAIPDTENLEDSELTVGDILFFSSGRALSDNEHIRFDDAGVYLGEGKFLHASQHTGRVQQNDVDDEYYKQRLKGVKRYF